MLTIFEELVSVAICSRSNLRSTGLKTVHRPLFSCSLIRSLNVQIEFLENWMQEGRVCRKDIKQLLDEVEHDIMNYQNRGLCYLPKPSASADNTGTRF